MKRKRTIRTPRLVMAVRESSTVDNKILKESQDLMILNTLRSLNALSTERLDEDLLRMRSHVCNWTAHERSSTDGVSSEAVPRLHRTMPSDLQGSHYDMSPELRASLNAAWPMDFALHERFCRGGSPSVQAVPSEASQGSEMARARSACCTTTPAKPKKLWMRMANS